MCFWAFLGLVFTPHRLCSQAQWPGSPASSALPQLSENAQLYTRSLPELQKVASGVTWEVSLASVTSKTHCPSLPRVHSLDTVGPREVLLTSLK